jgi:hypothetical protein
MLCGVVVDVTTIFARFRQQNAVVRVGLALLALPPLDACATVRRDEVLARSAIQARIDSALVDLGAAVGTDETVQATAGVALSGSHIWDTRSTVGTEIPSCSIIGALRKRCERVIRVYATCVAFC